MKDFRDWHYGRLTSIVIVLALSAWAFGEWMESAAAGWWMFLFPLVLDEIADRRTAIKAYSDYRERETALSD
jgi:hypothetical protein